MVGHESAWSVTKTHGTSESRAHFTTPPATSGHLAAYRRLKCTIVDPADVDP